MAPGQPTLHVSGQFAGFTMRAILSEVQKPDRGRKCAKIDKRPLDPPPIVLLRLFRLNGVNDTETEVQDYADIQTAGIICAVDLFPAGSVSQGSSSPASPTAAFLTGTTFVQATLTDDPKTQKKCLMFLFPNLFVEQEGFFVLRYRVFDLLAPHSSSHRVLYDVQAECFGGSFQVYSSSTFPGLCVSTPLTKQLCQDGAHVNIRQRERKRGSNDAKSPDEAITSPS